MTGVCRALGPCFACKQLFGFDPDTVPSVLIDPQTGKPPDVDPAPGGRERARREPLCPNCVAEINPQRAERGLPPLVPGPGHHGLDDARPSGLQSDCSNGSTAARPLPACGASAVVGLPRRAGVVRGRGSAAGTGSCNTCWDRARNL
jgi:hypothetical protein